jgi:hypothetical protein
MCWVCLELIAKAMALEVTDHLLWYEWNSLALKKGKPDVVSQPAHVRRVVHYYYSITLISYSISTYNTHVLTFMYSIWAILSNFSPIYNHNTHAKKAVFMWPTKYHAFLTFQLTESHMPKRFNQGIACCQYTYNSYYIQRMQKYLKYTIWAAIRLINFLKRKWKQHHASSYHILQQHVQVLVLINPGKDQRFSFHSAFFCKIIRNTVKGLLLTLLW